MIHPAYQLPDWVFPFIQDYPRETFGTLDGRMRFVIALAEQNIRHETGGPFGAAVFKLETSALVAPGLNLVVPSQNATAHAEVVAIALAGQAIGQFDLAGCELIASTEPCAMCFGATHWSGVDRLVVGARDADARAIGFDEGPKLDDWVMPLRKQGVDVVTDFLRPEAVAALQLYAEKDGLIYNGRSL